MELGTGELALRLALAGVLGAAVGIERETAARGAGARTHALVALGAALFTVAGAYGFADVDGSTDVDPARVAAQVAAGVGFIGAGAIIRHGTTVLGVTTAATVWLAAAMGVAVAAGVGLAAAMSTVGALLVLVAFRALKPLTQRIGRQKTIVELEYQRGHGTLGPFLRSLEECDMRVQHLRVDDDDHTAETTGVRRVTVLVAVRRIADLDRLIDDLGRRPEIRSVRMAAGEA